MSQRQQGGDESVNVQSGGDTYITMGVSVSDARQIAVDVLRANLIEIQGVARQVFDDRLNYFVDHFLAKLQSIPQNFEALADPDVQYSLFVAGKDYARSGDEHRGHILVDLLVERCRAQQASLLAVVLNEAIATAGRLTRNHIATLATNWAVVRMENGDIKTLDDLGKWIHESVLPFANDACWHVADYEYLAYTGTAGIEVTSDGLGNALRRNYPGLFSEGISPGMITPALQEHKEIFFSEHSTKAGFYRVNAIRTTDAHNLATHARQPHLGDALQELLRQTTAPKDSVEETIRNLSPEFSDLADLWSLTHLENLRLTSVGVAIAHAYWGHITKMHAPLSIWIPENDVPSKMVRR